MAVLTRKTDHKSRVTLPEDFADQTVTIQRVGEGELLIRRKKTLAELMAGVTPDNLHGETDFGPPRGNEVW